MKKRTFILTLFTTLFLSGCYTHHFFPSETIRGNGNVITEERAVPDFNSLRITGARRTVLYGDHDGPIKITGDSNIISNTVSYVENGRLVITSKKNVSLKPTKRVLIEVPGRYVNSVRISGSNEITLVDIDQEYFSVRGSGSTKIVAEGIADQLDIRMSGSSDIDAAGLVAEVVSIHTSGSSNADIHVLQSLDSRSSGSSKINFLGRPQTIENRSTGSSRIRSIH